MAEDWNWALRGFMVPHSCVRFATLKFLAAVDGLADSQKLAATTGEQSGDQAACFNALRDWYNKYYLSYVHEHHDIEEKVYFPWISEQVQAKGLPPISEKVAAQHVDLVKALELLQKLLTELAASAAPQSPTSSKKAELLMQLKKEAHAFAGDLFEHLDEEEQNICPLMRKGLAEETVQAKETEIVQSLGLGMAKMALPWIYESLLFFDPTPEKRVAATFYEHLPPPLRFFMWASWTGEHERSNTGVIEALANGNVPAAPAGIFSCSCSKK
eukprot:CAMPEP_0178408172 /NCGR_PEP_ID=MMETSP0689_2-20121128/19803_1 /TAXON_ID=160604 /ORGANISM="Amphidinium massartii, Strain CS-259" /LENGTH=270 /DNA_ID=CAMNT_0020029261 /DNA_START=120 /DNA_END=932 /DNA_ORIENTATION=-